MKRNLLLCYQLLTGLSDSGTGILLVFAPAFTLHLMGLHTDAVDLALIAYIGAFVLSTGLACLYGATLVRDPELAPKLEVVWLLTAITRSLVAAFVIAHVLDASLERGWITVAITDGLFALVQIIGLAKGWLRHADR